MKKIISFITSPVMVFLATSLAVFANIVLNKLSYNSTYTISDQLFNNLAIILLGLLFLLVTLLRSRTIKQLKATIQTASDDPEPLALANLRDLEGLPEAISVFVKKNNQKATDLAQENLDYFAANKVLAYKANSFGAVLQELPDAVLLFNESGEVSFANRKVTSLLACSADINGLRVHEFVQEDELREFLGQYQGKRRLCRAEKIEFCPLNNPEKHILAAAYPLLPKDDSPAPLGTLVILRDITSEVMARKARGEFVSHVSHELKSPLNVLKMYSEMLMDQGADNKEFRLEAVNTIYDEVDRLETLINNLLSISKIEMGSIALNRQRVKSVEFFEDTFRTICRTGKKSDLTFKLDLPNEISPISIDKDLFRVALNNLLTNAIKYNTRGGSVQMIVRETHEKISIMVKDTGLGISEEDQAKIFDKFFRSEDSEVRERSGHGVGLSLAKSIIELHHGKLYLTSVLKKGTTFTLDMEKGEGLVSEGI